MQQSFDSFFTLFNLTLVDFDDYYGDQCVDLVQFYSRFLGGPRFTGDAIDLANQIGGFYTWEANTPTNTPPKGAIVVFGEPYGRYIDDKGVTRFNGHCGIATGIKDVNSCELFEQNDPNGSNCHTKVYAYDGCLGWLIKKETPIESVTEITPSDVNTLDKVSAFFKHMWTGGDK
jgi:hypothetical protein